MNPNHRDWPPPPGQGPSSLHRDAEQQQQSHRSSLFRPSPPTHPSHSSPHNNTGGLPHPSSGPFVPYQQSGPGLPNLAGLSQPSSRHPSQPSGPHAGYPAPASAGNTAQEVKDRDIPIKEEQDAAARREQDAARRERDARLDQMTPHQTQPGSMHIHQPVAVGPRTVHGPNGLLANAAAISGPGPHAQLGAPTGPANIFGGGPVQPAGQAGPPGAPGLLVPFTGGAQAAAVGQGQQPILNDALSYLDQVKVQFVEHPDVYNRFLDIMKDFKSGAIDTPGVIDRVSSLFAGNPDLIQGFNTFLPPGYRIECGTGDDPNAIRVTTPMGTTVQAMPTIQRPLSRNIPGGQDGASDMPGRAANGSYTPQPHGQQGMFSPSGRPIGPATVSAQLSQAQHSMTMEAQAREQAFVHQQEQRGVSSLTNAVSAATNGALPRQAAVSPSGRQTTPLPGQDAGAGMDGQGGAGEKRGPVEFNHAISYVNKIKNRFSSQPDIYKQFLEILQTYQRESKPIQDVYGQVTRLFHTAPDLLEDFKQFLPESAAHARAAAAAKQQAEEAAILSNVRGDAGGAPQGVQATPRADHRLPPVGNFAPTPTLNKEQKRKRNDRQGTVVSGLGGAAPDVGPIAAKSLGNVGQAANMNKRTKHTHVTKHDSAPDAPQLSPTLVPALPEPLPPTTSSSATADELGFFDRAKKTIGNKNTMNEFLKLCNLYSQDLIDNNTLVHRARSFIGGNVDLFNWFKTWLKYKDNETVVIENRARAPTSRISLSNCRGLGPSYRLLPKRERQKPCSGRDELCYQVLNDDWASHPTWASEDSGFISHRKNVHEEGLHKIEEERHDYDFNIEACSRTIQLLEPIAHQLLRMTEQERNMFEIPAGIGGQSETIHKRVIKKLYGREKGQEVIEELHKRPIHVVPILLNRLKQKLEEWKMAQREWEKVWREQTSKMFWKSLDHQAVNIKQNDKKQFQAKTLTAEIQTKYEEAKRQRANGSNPTAVLKPQMVFELENVDVVIDSAYLIITWAEQMHSTEHPRLPSFLREFFALFLGLDPEWFNEQLRTKFGSRSGNDTGDENVSVFDDALGSKPRKTAGKKDDLRRGVLDRGHRGGRKDEGSATPLSRASTPDASSRVDDDEGAAAPGDDALEVSPDLWAQYPAGMQRFKDRNVALDEAFERHEFNFYANSPIYFMLRMFQLLYERLLKLKQAESSVHETVERAMAPKPAIELGLVDKLPTDYFAEVGPHADYYRQLLGMCEDFIKNDMEQAHIEETLRRYYLRYGYGMYNFDKLVGGIVRNAISILTNEGRDAKTWEIMQLFKKDRAKGETTIKAEMEYRHAVEKLIKEGDIYKITYNPDKSELSIKVFKKDDPTFDLPRLEAEDQWRIYVHDYLSTRVTVGVRKEEVNFPAMRRSMRTMLNTGSTSASVATTDEAGAATGRRFDMVRAKESLNFRIAVGSLEVAFNPGDEEYWSQIQSARENAPEGIEEAVESPAHRVEEVQDHYAMNNGLMKGLSKEDVEGKNGTFVALLKDEPGASAVAAGVGGNVDEDKEMEDA